MLTINKFTQKQVPGVEADDVIGTLSVRSVDAGYKVGFSSNNWQKNGRICRKSDQNFPTMHFLGPVNEGKRFPIFLVGWPSGI